MTFFLPLKFLFKYLKKGQTFISSFRDKPVEGSNSSSKRLDFFNIPWRFHI